jgi:hypothetical protein
MNNTFDKLYDLSLSISTPGIKSYALEGAGTLFHTTAKIINRFQVQCEIEEALEDLADDVQELLKDKPSNGVLICIGVAEWKRHDDQGLKQHRYLGAHIVGVGKTPSEAKQTGKPVWVTGAPQDWIRLNRYIWMTVIGRSNLDLNSITDGY